MNGLALFGFVAVGAMALFYALEERGPAFTLAFGCACVAASIYGFLAGTWPFGIIEGLWALLALYRWRRRLAQPAAYCNR
jgi:hypothetical protein